IDIQLCINGIVGPAHKAAVFLITLKNCDPEVFPIRSHLGDVSDGQRALDVQINVGWTLQRDRAVGSAIFFRDARGGKRSVFELNIYFAMDRTRRCQAVDYADKLGSV